MENFQSIITIVGQGGIGLLLVYILYTSWKETKKEAREDYKELLQINKIQSEAMQALNNKLDIILNKVDKCPYKEK